MMKKGFTLVEIMIVVSIIGFIVAIAVPMFIKARDNAQREACQSNLTKYDGAIVNYILDSNIRNLADSPFPGLTTDNPTARNLLVGRDLYIKSDGHCPASGVYTFLATEGNVGESIRCSLFDVPPAIHVFPGYPED